MLHAFFGAAEGGAEAAVAALLCVGGRLLRLLGTAELDTALALLPRSRVVAAPLFAAAVVVVVAFALCEAEPLFGAREAEVDRAVAAPEGGGTSSDRPLPAPPPPPPPWLSLRRAEPTGSTSPVEVFLTIGFEAAAAGEEATAASVLGVDGVAGDGEAALTPSLEAAAAAAGTVISTLLLVPAGFVTAAGAAEAPEVGRTTGFAPPPKLPRRAPLNPAGAETGEVSGMTAAGAGATESFAVAAVELSNDAAEKTMVGWLP